MTLYVDAQTESLEDRLINYFLEQKVWSPIKNDFCALISWKKFLISTPQGAIEYKKRLESFLIPVEIEQFWKFVEDGPTTIQEGTQSKIKD